MPVASESLLAHNKADRGGAGGRVGAQQFDGCFLNAQGGKAQSGVGVFAGLNREVQRQTVSAVLAGGDGDMPRRDKIQSENEREENTMFHQGYSIEAHKRISTKSKSELLAIRERFATLENRTEADYEDYALAGIYLRYPWLAK